MFLQIDGWRGAGKSALWTLLDGHKKVFCSPIHDTAFEGFTNERSDSEWIKNKDIKEIRRRLSTTGYYKFEVFSHAEVFYMDFSAEGDRLAIPFDLDFYKFDKVFMKTLSEADKWNIEFIVHSLYETLKKNYSNNKIPTKYFAAMGAPKDWRYNSFHKVLPNAKCIQVRRDVKGIISTISNRKPNPLDKSSQSGYAKSFKKRIKGNEVEKILTYYEAYDNLIKKFPDTYFVVDFKNLVENTEETMKRVANFLDINFTDILTVATRDGKELICNGKKYVGEVYDDPSKLLTDQERKEIEWRYFLYSFHKQNFYPISTDTFKKVMKKIFKV